jgi:hypothetical protein
LACSSESQFHVRLFDWATWQDQINANSHGEPRSQNSNHTNLCSLFILCHSPYQMVNWSEELYITRICIIFF